MVLEGRKEGRRALGGRSTEGGREPSAVLQTNKILGREGRDEMPRMETPNVNIGSLLVVPRRRTRNKDGIPRWTDATRTKETL